LKKLTFFAATAFILIATGCGSTGNQNSEQPASAGNETSKDAPPAAEMSEGQKLMTSNDCGTCHTEQQKVVGPAFKDIAAKYPNTPENVAHLVDQVIKGSTNVWGQVPMIPHPNLQKADVEKMVQYILSVK